MFRGLGVSGIFDYLGCPSRNLKEFPPRRGRPSSWILQGGPSWTLQGRLVGLLKDVLVPDRVLEPNLALHLHGRLPQH